MGVIDEQKKALARSRAKAWREANPERAKAAIEKCKAAKPEKYKALQAAIFQKNKAARMEYMRKWRAKNRARDLEMKRKWAAENPEKKKQAGEKWRINNQEKVNAILARRRAAKKNAVPKWANHFFIGEIYDLARLRSKATGFQWDVDHIVPLQSHLVCGLHVEHNLQVIPSTLNKSKLNRTWPGMP